MFLYQKLSKAALQKDWMNEFPADPFDVKPQVYRNWLCDTLKKTRDYAIPDHIIKAWLEVLIRRRDCPNKKCFRPTRDLFDAIADHIIQPYLIPERKKSLIGDKWPGEPNWSRWLEHCKTVRRSRPSHRSSTVDWF